MITPENIIIIQQLFVDSSVSTKGILGLSEVFGVVHLSLGKCVKLLMMKESSEASFTKYETSLEDLKQPISVEVKNCQYFWDAKKTKKKAKVVETIEEDARSDNYSLHETQDLSKFGLKSETIDLDIYHSKVEQEQDPPPQEKRQKRRPKFILTLEEFTAKKGTLTSIVGRMGCGKTSLIKAIIGEMPC
jgi:ABC-type glutathione transport system ATPase component